MLRIYSLSGGLSRLILSFIFVFTVSGVCAQTIRINEFLALNRTILADVDGDYSDWIEIYNPTGASVNLQDWSLTDEETLPGKWIFPDVSIDPDQYLVVFASGKDFRTPGSELHTNFKLSGDGEYLALINPSGVVVNAFSPAFPIQEDDISFGYLDGEYVQFSTVTPGAENPNSGASIIPSPTFSQKHGFYDAAFNLELSSGISNTSIYYTLDGSEPSVSNGTLYGNAININKTSVVRAVAILDGQSPSVVATQSYLFVDDIVNQPNNPAGYPDEWGPFERASGNAPSDYEMDPELVSNSQFAEDLKESLKELPAISIVTKKGNFFSHDYDEITGGIYIYTGFIFTDNPLGRDWERPISFELFDNSESMSLQVNCGITINGGHSRMPDKDPKHSFRLRFRSKYGPSKLNYPVFGDEAADEFNTLILRGGFNNTWLHSDDNQRERATYHRDTWSKDIQRRMGHPSSHARYTHLFINGLYWGIYTIAERMDKDFAASYMEGSDDEFDVIKDYSEVMDGNGDAWDELISTVNSGAITNPIYYKLQGKNPDGSFNYAYKPLLDMDNLIDYMLINMYGANTDWDHHNWAAMYNRVEWGPGYKFLSWDAEHVLEGLSDNVTSEYNTGCPSNIFQNLMQNELFKRRFADRVYMYMYNDGLLTPDKAREVWMERYDLIEKSIVAESARWGDYRRDVHNMGGELYTKSHWLEAEDYMQNTYFRLRTSRVLNQFRSAGFFPDVDIPVLYLNDIETQGKSINRGDILSMSVDNGEIYYTLDGSDPVREVAGVMEKVLVKVMANKQVLVPASGFNETDWNTTEYNAAAWTTSTGSPGGIGYENNSGYESDISLDVGNDMSGQTPACLIRIPFTIEDVDMEQITTLTLNVLYDDGFVAYLNGEQIAAVNAPATLTYTSTSDGSHEAENYETFNVASYISSLKEGENVLAIHGLNQSLTSSDFLINASLLAGIKESDDGPQMAGVYSTPLTLTGSVHLKARTFYNNEWSALSEAFFTVDDDIKGLRITEINYHPEGTIDVDGDKFEFLELKNTGDFTINLSGVQLIKGISYVFPEGTYLQPGDFIVLAADEEDFFDRYGFFPFDEYDGRLDNNGERIIVASAQNDTLCNVRYFDDYPWPAEPDGFGYTLVPELANPMSNQDSSVYWRITALINGSPGRDDPGSAVSIRMPVLAEDISTNAYPNPFNDRISISFDLPNRADVQLSIVSITGQTIRSLADGSFGSGTHIVDWDGRSASGAEQAVGIYFYQLKVSESRGSIAKKGKIIRIK